MTARRPPVPALVALAVVLAAAGAASLPGPGGVARASAAPRVRPEVPVTATDHMRSPASNSPSAVAHPHDPRFVAIANRLDAPDFGCALQLSGDGGRTWAGARPVTTLPPGADKCYAPELAFDADGVLHYLFVGLHGAGNEPMGAFLTTSGDGGRTFTAPRQVLGPLNFAVRMAIDRTSGRAGRLHLVWLHAGGDPPLGGFPPTPNPILAAYSDDGGASFSAPVQVNDPHRARVVAPALALGADRRVHVGYYDLGDDVRDYQGLAGPVWDGTWSIVVASSKDGGRRFTTGSVVDDRIAPPERPMLIFTMAPPALAAGDGRLCAAWTDARHGDPDVVLRCADEDGRRWGQLHRLNDDRVGNGVRQYLPRLASAPGGRIDAVFLDRRHRPANTHNDVSYTYSTDGGRSFSPNTRVTRESGSVQVGAEYAGPAAEGQFEIGNRLALLSSPSGALAAWPDTRNSGNAGTAQDVFAAEVVPRAGGGGGGVGTVGALVGGGAGLAVLVLAGRWTRALRQRSRREGNKALTRPGDADGAPGSGGRTNRLLPVLGLLLCVAVAAGLLLQGRATPRRARLALPSPPQVVELGMTEYSYDYVPPAGAGRTVFRVRNAGREDHRVGLFPVPDDFPPIADQLRGEQRRSLPIFANLPVRAPGQTQRFAVDLVAGQRYALLCFVPASDGQVHAALGMSSEFRPVGPGGTSPG